MTVIVRFFSILAVVVLPCFARAQTPGRIDGARTGCSILRADKLKGSQLGLGPGA